VKAFGTAAIRFLLTLALVQLGFGAFLTLSDPETASASEIFLQYQTESYFIKTPFASYNNLSVLGFAGEYVRPLTNSFHARGVAAISLSTGDKKTIPVFIDVGGGAALSISGGAPISNASPEFTMEVTPLSHLFAYVDFVSRIFDVTGTVEAPTQLKVGERRRVTRKGNYITPRVGIGYDMYLNPDATSTVGVRVFATQSLNLKDSSITTVGAAVSIGYQFSEDILFRLFTGG
jgi:hypothetical protein